MSEVVEVNDDNDEDDGTWKSCCIKSDQDAVVYFSQLTIALIVMIFCLYMLLHSDSCERDSLYSGVLSLILGCYLPTPSMRKK